MYVHNNLQVNTFQAVLAADAERTFVVFLYNDIQWANSETTIGLNAGDSIHFYVPFLCQQSYWLLDLDNGKALYDMKGILMWPAHDPFEC